MSGSTTPVAPVVSQPVLPRQRSRKPERVRRSERTADLVRALAATTEACRRQELLQQIILVNQVVARDVASRYRGRGVEQDDLDQVALEALTKAVHRFDPDTENDLLSYAVPTIRGELQRYFRDLGWAVRPPRRVQELQWHVSHTIDRLTQELGRDPDRHDVITAIGVDAAEYDAAMSARGCFRPSSLDQPLQAGGPVTLADFLPGVELASGSGEARAILGPVLRRLPERDRQILYLRFFEDLTQAEIGERIGVTQMQVSRLLTSVLTRLRTQILTGEAQAS